MIFNSNYALDGESSTGGFRHGYMPKTRLCHIAADKGKLNYENI